MDEDPYQMHGATISTRRQATTRRPGEASRQPIERHPDVEPGLTRAGGGVQFDIAATAGGGGGNTGLNRKRTLIRPERQRVDPTHRNFFYLQHTQQQNMSVQASTTGNRANVPIDEYDDDDNEESPLRSNTGYSPGISPQPSPTQPPTRGKSILGRDVPQQREPLKPVVAPEAPARLRKNKGTIRRPKPQEPAIEMTPWVFYCRTITCCIPPVLLRCFGVPGKMQQQAWREKIGLITIIFGLGTFVGFLTFGFTQAVCSTPPISFNISQITSGYLVIHGLAYDLTHSSHPAAIGVPSESNVLYPPVNAGGFDASFMFQNVNSKCKGLITATASSNILHDSKGNLGWYFPCNLFSPDGQTPVNLSQGPYPGYACHTMSIARQAYYKLAVTGEVVFNWQTLKNSSRNLVVYSGYELTIKPIDLSNVLDLNLLSWLDKTQVNYPPVFDDLRSGPLNAEIRGTDVTHLFSRLDDRTLGQCLVEIIKVGTVDNNSVGCVASQVVLYISLVFIIGIVLSKFIMALWFHWFLAWKIGAHKNSGAKNKKRRMEIEEWSDDIFRQAPNIPTIRTNERPKSHFFPNTSRFTPKSNQFDDRPGTGYKPGERRTKARQGSTSNLLQTQSVYGDSIHTHSGVFDETPRVSTFMGDEEFDCFHPSVVPQPPPEYMPFGFPLTHVLSLITCYNESMAGLRTTFDSIATSEYPNSHKCLFVICDGNVKGTGEPRSTPEYVVSMMKDFAVPAEEVQAFSYVAIANGSKRHNMAKVYAGFYDYDDTTVPPEKQQRVPMICVAKCGTSREASDPKPGNRGKRDSQIILMSFLQKVLFDERMTELEYEIFTGIWKVSGLSPDVYDLVLMVWHPKTSLIIRLMQIPRFSQIH